uniref:Uncharacterized protein n=1 Tax=Oryza barthii TaxID=65489 RepID=A0A0D3HSR6_9ORYZ
MYNGTCGTGRWPCHSSCRPTSVLVAAMTEPPFSFLLFPDLVTEPTAPTTSFYRIRWTLSKNQHIK